VPLSRAGINIIAPILLIAWLLKKLKFRKAPQEKMGYLEIVRWVGFLGLVVLLSLINAQNLAAAFKNIVDEYVILALIFIISLDVIKSKEQLRKLFWIGLVAFLIVVGVGFYQYFGLGYKRIDSTFSVATQTGVYFVGTVLLNLAFLFFRKTSSRLTLIGSSLLLFVNLACLIMTGTRAAWLGFFAGTFFLLVLAIKNNKLISHKQLIIVFVIVVLAAVLFDLGWVIERLASVTDLSNSSNQQRIKMLLGGLEMLKDHPLTGVGIGQFPLVYENYLLPGAGVYTHIHCFYLHLVVELGLIGFLVFFTLVYKVLKTGIIMSAQQSGEKSWFYYGVLGVLVGIGVCNLFDWTFLNLQVGSFTLILVAVWLNEIKPKSV
jgi:O-antigen ligase